MGAVSGGGGAAHVPPKSRLNGWTWPPNPLQIVAWVVYLVLGLLYFIGITPNIVMPWQILFYVVSFEKIKIDKINGKNDNKMGID